MSVRRWIMPELDKETAAQLAEDGEIQPFLALLLVTRGVTDVESASDFLSGGSPEGDPFAFADMDAAVDRIGKALDTGERIAIYGDYDVDGVTSTVLLYTYLKKRGADVIYYIPEREGEGYGLHRDSVEKLHRQGVRLIVTVDNGISACEEVAYAAELGMDVVVTDHHQPPAELPRAAAVVDPHRVDCASEFKDYAGVGVAFQLVCALEGDIDEAVEQFADLAALGTLADVMPLRGENRCLVKEGLKSLNRAERPGIAALRRVAGVDGKELTSTSAVFSLAPRLNAAGRMASPSLAARLLLADSVEEADKLAAEIQACNERRRAAEREILTAIQQRLDENPALLSDRVLVLEGEGWHPGVVGILASRVVERYGKPAILIALHNGEGVGSGRSVKGFSLYDAIASCAQVLTRFGGHELAAGLSLPSDCVEEFRRRVNAFAAENYARMPVPELRLDFKIRPSQVDVGKLALIAALEPLGAGNPAPVFGLYGMRLDNVTPLAQGRHVRLSVSRDDARLSVVCFNMPYETFPYECGQTVNLAVSLERNEYKGVVTVTVLLKDMRAAAMEQEELIAALQDFDALARDEALTPETLSRRPDRVHLTRIYRFLRAKRTWNGTLDQLCFLLGEPAVPYLTARLALEILRQAGLVELSDAGGSLQLALCPTEAQNGAKADLTATTVWRRLHAQTQK